MNYLIVLIMLLYSHLSIAQPTSRIGIVMWHSLAGQLGLELDQLVAGFNNSQADFTIKPVYKGEYTDTITSFAAAFRAKQAPGLVQIFEVGTATMLVPTGIIKPLATLLQEQHVSLPTHDFLPALRSFYSHSGQLQAMPFNTSIPVMYYNANALARVGVNDALPQTWQELEALVVKLKQAGYTCAYTSAYPAWIHIESFLALHGLPLVDPLTHKANYNNPALIHHLERLQRWHDQHYFTYGGRASDATVLFTSGRCPIFSQSSGSYASLKTMATFPINVAALPLDTSISTSRHANVVGGGALWAVAGQRAIVYRGIALFYAYLAQPANQARWQERTGYIPVGLTGRYASVLQTGQPMQMLALQELNKPQSTRVGAYGIPQHQIRAINDELLEMIFANIKAPKQALTDAVERANSAILRFARNTGINQ